MRLHLFALTVFAGLVVLWAGIMAVALRAAALPDDHRGVAVAVFPPGWGDREAMMAAVVESGALPVRGTWFGNVWFVAGDQAGYVERLRDGGAWAAFSPEMFRPVALGGCFTSPSPPG